MKIEICMGSSCFARGNAENLELIEKMMTRGDLDANVTLSGKRCENRCIDGPNIRINGKLYNGVDREMLLDLLSDS